MRQMTLMAFLQAQNCTNLPASWRHPESRTDFLSPDFYREIARVLEAGKFHLDGKILFGFLAVVQMQIHARFSRLARRSRELDRLEREDEAFHQRVAAGYQALAAADRATWAVVDGLGVTTEVAGRVLAVVTERLGAPGGLAKTGPN